MAYGWRTVHGRRMLVKLLPPGVALGADPNRRPTSRYRIRDTVDLGAQAEPRAVQAAPVRRGPRSNPGRAIASPHRGQGAASERPKPFHEGKSRVPQREAQL